MVASRDAAATLQTSQVFAMTQTDVPPCTILLVENDMNATDFMRRILESAGYFVLEASDSSEAADMALALLPDMILLDIQLSGGWVLLETLKAEPDTVAIPVILCMAYDDQATAPEVTTTLRKPFTTHEFLQAVEDTRQAQPR